MQNEKNNRKRIYIGPVVSFGSQIFLLPLSSAKLHKDYEIIGYNNKNHEIHRLLQPEKDQYRFFILDNSNTTVLSKVYISKMIPVPISCIKMVDFREEDQRYVKLLSKEANFVRKKEHQIVQRARAIYYSRMAGTDLQILRKTPDFICLEQKCEEWINDLNIDKENEYEM